MLIHFNLLGVEKSAPFLKVGGNMIFEVNGEKWKIVNCNPNDENLRRSDGTITLGVTDNNTKCVYMNNRLSDYMYDKVLCHELCHVFAFSFDYYMEIETEEIVADFMSLYGRKIIYLLDDLVKLLKVGVA